MEELSIYGVFFITWQFFSNLQVALRIRPMNDDEILMGATQIAHKVQKKVQIKGEKNVKSNWQASNKFLVCIISVSVDYNYA